MPDPFEVIGAIPKGTRYVWAAVAVEGQEWLGNRKTLEQQGWTPVPRERHPLMLASKGEICVGDQVLMERPADETERDRLQEMQKKENEFVEKIERLGFSGSFRGALGNKRIVGDPDLAEKIEQHIPRKNEETT